jgi:putative DNA primase/helicase
MAEKIHLGEIQGKGSQCVIAGSIHPKTNKEYKVLNDLPIAKLPVASYDAIKNLYDKKKGSRTFIVKASNWDIDVSEIGKQLRIESLMNLSEFKPYKDGEVFGPNPWHGSTTGQNTFVNLNKNLLRCFRHNCGYDSLGVLALNEGLIECGEKLRGDKFLKAVKIAEEKYGIKTSSNKRKKIKKYDEIGDLRDAVLANLVKDRRFATELICIHIESNEHIYVTRDDQKTEFWIYKDGIYVPHGKTYIRELCREILKEAYTAQLANEVINKVEADRFVDAKEFFNSEVIEEIPVQNGVLNVITKELKPFSPEKIFFNKLPITYDPTKNCPNVDKFFTDIIKNDSDIPILYEIFGYCLLKDYRIQKSIMLNGSGANGKSRFLELLKRFLGPENCVSIPLQEFEKDDFSISQLHGKLANISSDLSSEALKYTGNFKTITGGDPISANRKFLSRLTFTNYSKQLYSANQLPRVYEIDPAFFRRWILLDFVFMFMPTGEYNKLSVAEKEEKIENKPKYRIADPTIIDKIVSEDELSGLLNKALDGLKVMLEKKEFSYSKSIEEIKLLWIRKSDSFQAFCMDCVTQDSLGFTKKEDLRQYYSEYCRKHKLNSLGDKAIKETLTRLYGVVEDRKVMEDRSYMNIWKGITLKEDGGENNVA